jgi:Domain of unknown function (DUF4338)
MEPKLSYRHRAVSASDVAFIRALIAEHPGASRRELSRKLCTAWNWVQANGAPRDMVCRGLMLKLHREGLITLPPVRYVPPNPLAERGAPAVVSVDAQPLQASLAEIQPLELRQVRRTPDEALFNSLLAQHHYLGYTQPVGEQLKYLVLAQGRPLACLAFSSAPRHLGSRDRFIGWSVPARRKNIHLIAYNTRFLVLPWVKVPHLASHLLARIARELSGDWGRRYGHPIYFVETFVDPQRFRGTCYRAANWIDLGHTTGRGKDAPTHQPTRAIKRVLGYPLSADFRQQLCAP